MSRSDPHPSLLSCPVEEDKGRYINIRIELAFLIRYNNKLAKLSLGDWLKPEKVGKLAERLGVDPKLLFLRLSEALTDLEKVVKS